MTGILGVYAYSVKAQAPRRGRYYAEMPNRTMRAIVAANVKAMRLFRKLTQPGLAQRCSATFGRKIDTITISRVELNKQEPGVETIYTLAKGLDIEPWQLLVYDLDPSRLPAAKVSKPSKADIDAVEKVKNVVADLTPEQRELFVNTDEGRSLVEHFPVEKMDGQRWSAASKPTSRKSDTRS
jgi:transcriptional regulator with XRE-family HTH domain